MSAEQNVKLFSGEAHTACTIYRFVVRDATTKQFDMVSGAQGEMDGIAAETVSVVGQSLPIVMMNAGTIAKIESGAAISAGAVLASDSSGRAITAVSGAGNWEAGKAIDAASGAGEIIRFMVLKQRDQA